MKSADDTTHMLLMNGLAHTNTESVALGNKTSRGSVNHPKEMRSPAQLRQGTGVPQYS